MSHFKAQIADSLAAYYQGGAENAFFSLVELAPEALHELIAEYHAATDADLRAFLLHVIWQNRQPSSVPLLGEALREGERILWRQAMDGLVALACPEALEALRSARGREFPKARAAEEFHAWLGEAIEQAS